MCFFVQHTLSSYSSLINSVCYVLFVMTFIECCLA
ncbi:putative membrane protein [Vibrio cholerae]|nr:putative membrane protein [Vibrio cholerae]